ncbi:UDP-glycosyltransferase 75C1-like [Actinidia eriantha]|uniref:UDP-glycosyltransferase 75C1-like n=1 Tax=Actinidia eriantha TaxID=165200 RepID=UPI00259058D5|nr:UDP-glycosyltransferase 75C1-like [Actinidia eriantha]
MAHTHILLLLFPSHGAITPSLQFAKNLIRIGVKVTVATTIFAHRCMITKTSQTIATFSDGYDDGFKDVHKVDHFLSEFKNRGSQALEEIIGASAKEGHPVTCLVYTMLHTWVDKLAHTFHIQSAVFWIQPATVFDIYYFYFNGYGDNIRKIIDDYPSSSIGLPYLPQLTRRDLPSFMVTSNPNYDKFGMPAFEEQLDTLAKAKTRILVNTFDALESEALRAIEKHNMIAIGPLVPSPFLHGKDQFDASFRGDHLEKSRDYVEWLDLKVQSSVVYVSFGTNPLVALSKRQREEIAHGLLKSHRPFLWVIKAIENGEKHEDKLSCSEELEQLGMIVPWCSQVDVLSHPSLGCFFTHCGWNSTLESLVSGVPMVGFPHFTDQPTNAKLIEDVFRTGVRVKVNEEGIVEADEIARCIEVIMGGGEVGEELKRNAKKWKDLAKEATKEGGSSDMNLRAFVEEMEA